MDVIHEEGDFECDSGMDGKPVAYLPSVLKSLMLTVKRYTSFDLRDHHVYKIDVIKKLSCNVNRPYTYLLKIEFVANISQHSNFMHNGTLILLN